jgi:hypothetical protein
MARVERALTDHFRAVGKTTSFVWNNLVKIGKNGLNGRPAPVVLDWQDHLFDLLRQEVAILRPHVVLFFTGPYYDAFLARAFPGVRFDPVAPRTVRQLARVRVDSLPEHSLRTYHPNYLWRKNFDGWLRDIVAAISMAAPAEV